MAFIKPEEFNSMSGFSYVHRFGLPSSPSTFQQQQQMEKLIPSPTLPLPSMKTFSNKRRLHSENTSYEATLPLPPLKVPKLISTTARSVDSSIPPPPPLVHQCTSEDCNYCSGLTNLDIAAYYWSMIALKYSKSKTSSSSTTTISNDSSSYEPTFTQTIPSPTTHFNHHQHHHQTSFDLTSYKPPSPSGSLTSMDSEPLSPSSSTTSESSSISKDNLNGIKYQCQVCHKSYSHPRLLNRHLQSHTPYKKHHCPRCRKGFNDAFDLKRHIRTHTGIKPFHCKLCEKSFTQVS